MAIVGFVPISGLWVVAWPACSQKVGSFHAVARPPDSTAAASRTASVIEAVRPMRRPARTEVTCRRSEGAAASGSARAAASLSAVKADDRLGQRSTGRRNNRDVGVKSIAAAWDCPDQAWAVISERTSQFADALHQCVVRDREVRPDRGEQLVFRDKPCAIFAEITQNGEGLRPKRNLATVQQQRAAIQIQDEAVESQSRRSLLCRRLSIILAIAPPRITAIQRLHSVRVNQQLNLRRRGSVDCANTTRDPHAEATQHARSGSRARGLAPSIEWPPSRGDG